MVLFLLILAQIRDELRELHEEVSRPAERPDDLVDATYVARRMSIKVKTVLEGKAGTNRIPRVLLKAEGATRPMIRFQRAAVDRYIDTLARAAVMKTPQQRVADLIKKRKFG